jgi:hypothetical protein
MKISKVALQLYLLASVVTVVSVFFDWKWVAFIVKPIIIPAIFYYYTQINKNKFNVVVPILLVINFISDMTTVFDFESKNEIVVALNLINNIILFYFFMSDFFILKNFDKRYFPQLTLFLIGFFIVTYITLTLMPGLNVIKLFYYLIYGIVLSFMATVSIQNFITSNYIRCFYAMLVSIAFIFTDTFYVIYNFYLPMKIFILFNLAIQFGSYYYLVKYFAAIPHNERNNERKGF